MRAAEMKQKKKEVEAKVIQEIDWRMKAQDQTEKME